MHQAIYIKKYIEIRVGYYMTRFNTDCVVDFVLEGYEKFVTGIYGGRVVPFYAQGIEGKNILEITIVYDSSFENIKINMKVSNESITINNALNALANFCNGTQAKPSPRYMIASIHNTLISYGYQLEVYYDSFEKLNIKYAKLKDVYGE